MAVPLTGLPLRVIPGIDYEIEKHLKRRRAGIAGIRDAEAFFRLYLFCGPFFKNLILKGHLPVTGPFARKIKIRCKKRLESCINWAINACHKKLLSLTSQDDDNHNATTTEEEGLRRHCRCCRCNDDNDDNDDMDDNDDGPSLIPPPVFVFTPQGEEIDVGGAGNQNNRRG